MRLRTAEEVYELGASGMVRNGIVVITEGLVLSKKTTANTAEIQPANQAQAPRDRKSKRPVEEVEVKTESSESIAADGGGPG